MTHSFEKIGFGGGCHWCTEAVFQSLKGVASVDQGFIASTPPDDSFSEAVIVRYDPMAIDLATLIEIHLRTHSSASNHAMRGKYRSAIYAVNAAQAADAEMLLKELQPRFEAPLVTRVLSLATFKLSDARYRNYHRKNPKRPFCRTYIDPKLSVLRQRYGDHIDRRSLAGETQSPQDVLMGSDQS